MWWTQNKWDAGILGSSSPLFHCLTTFMQVQPLTHQLQWWGLPSSYNYTLLPTFYLFIILESSLFSSVTLQQGLNRSLKTRFPLLGTQFSQGLLHTRKLYCLKKPLEKPPKTTTLVNFKWLLLAFTIVKLNTEYKEQGNKQKVTLLWVSLTM